MDRLRGAMMSFEKVAETKLDGQLKEKDAVIARVSKERDGYKDAVTRAQGEAVQSKEKLLVQKRESDEEKEDLIAQKNSAVADRDRHAQAAHTAKKETASVKAERDAYRADAEKAKKELARREKVGDVIREKAGNLEGLLSRKRDEELSGVRRERDKYRADAVRAQRESAQIKVDLEVQKRSTAQAEESARSKDTEITSMRRDLGEKDNVLRTVLEERDSSRQEASTWKEDSARKGNEINQRDAQIQRLQHTLAGIKKSTAGADQRVIDLEAQLVALQEAQLAVSAQPEKEKEIPPHIQERIDFVAKSGKVEEQGEKSTMEDRVMKTNLETAEKEPYFAVFDGYNGALIASFAEKEFQEKISEQIADGESVENAFRKSFREVDTHVKNVAGATGGSTATICIIKEGNLYTANVGDSTALLMRDGKAVTLTREHSLNDESEKTRVEKAGDSIDISEGSRLVNGITHLTRAIGEQYANGVIAEPHVQATKLTPMDSKLVLASSGLWNFVTQQDASELIRDAKSSQDAADALKGAALENGSMSSTPFFRQLFSLSLNDFRIVV